MRELDIGEGNDIPKASPATAVSKRDWPSSSPVTTIALHLAGVNFTNDSSLQQQLRRFIGRSQPAALPQSVQFFFFRAFDAQENLTSAMPSACAVPITVTQSMTSNVNLMFSSSDCEESEVKHAATGRCVPSQRSACRSSRRPKDCAEIARERKPAPP